jgi:glycosyltransferase involved in cell wall biosynthesis
MNVKTVSVVMATYNHAPFVAEAVRSVLEQSFDDFEFLIADDGSIDGTPDIVSLVQDSRIRFFGHRANRGACAVTNELIEKATGKYIALINSDDIWMPGKLSDQVGFLESHPDIAATFGRARFINRDSQDIPPDRLPSFATVFDQANRSRGAWLRRFFVEGNCLCHPTILIRRDVYDYIGAYSNRLRQLPDFDMWIRLVKAYSFNVSPDPMIRYRVLPGENASSDIPGNRVRVMNEHFLIALRFFDGVSAALLRDGFSDRLVSKDVSTEIHCDIEKALLYFTPAPDLDHMYKVVGLNKLYDLLNSANHRDILASEYQIDDRAFQALAAQADAFRPPSPSSPEIALPRISSRLLLHELVHRLGSKLRR